LGQRATNHRAFWWKMTYKDQASYDSTPPCKKTRSCVWHGSLIECIQTRHGLHFTAPNARATGKELHWNVWHDSFICVTWPVHMWHMTHSNVWHDQFTCVTWLVLVHICNTTRSYVWHDSLIKCIHTRHGVHLLHCYKRQGNGQRAAPHPHWKRPRNSSWIFRCLSPLLALQSPHPYEKQRINHSLFPFPPLSLLSMTLSHTLCAAYSRA